MIYDLTRLTMSLLPNLMIYLKMMRHELTRPWGVFIDLMT